MDTEIVTAPSGSRVIVISVMKAGTHLMQELMVALGYGIYGQTRITPDIRPVLDDDTRRRIAGMVYDEKTAAELATANEADFRTATDRAWEALAWTWQIRFGMPLVNRYSRAVVETDLVEQTRRRTATTSFSETPPGVCWIFTELDIAKVDGHFLEEWMSTGEPRVIFNYRDPRDVVLSMVNFLAGKTARGYGNFNEFPVFNRILESRSTLDEQLKYALTDPSFPGYRAYENALWLFNHPNVCKVSFEQLVGPQGGGSAEAQSAAARRVIEFLGLDADPDKVATQLFRRDAFSFFKGQIGSWREVFTPNTSAFSWIAPVRCCRCMATNNVTAVPSLDDARMLTTLTDGSFDIGVLWEFCAHFEWVDRPAMVDGICSWLGAGEELRILDCACGSGFPAIELAKRGYDVTCSDGSRVMLRHLRRNLESEGLAIPWEQVCWEHLADRFPASFDVIMCRGASFPYAGTWDDDRTPDRTTLMAAMRQFAGALRPHGRLYIDTTRDADLAATEPRRTRHPRLVLGSHVVDLEEVIANYPEQGIRTWRARITFDGHPHEFIRRSHYLTGDGLAELMTRAGLVDVRRVDIPGERYQVYTGRRPSQ